MLYKKIQDIKKRYDVIVIGGGLGGLTTANILSSKFQRKVLLIEQHFKLGGLATWFTRKGHIFDVSLHGFPVGMIKTCRRYWTKEIADSIVQLKNIRFSNPQFELTTTFDKIDFIDKIINKFGIDKDVVINFFETLRKMDFYDDAKMTTAELFDKFFPGRNDVIRMLMEPITYANGSTLNDPAITYGIVFSNFMSKGVFTFEGGTDLLIDKMQQELVKNGVDILLSHKVDKIMAVKGQVTGIKSADVEIECDSVVSNCNIVSTLTDLIDANQMDTQVLDEVKKIKINNSSCQVYMGIKEGERIEDVGDLIFTSKEPTFIPEKLLEKNSKSRTFSIYYPKTRPGSSRYSIVASSNAHYDDWQSLSEDEYNKSKNILVEDTLNSLEQFLPDIREKIDYINVATPKTFKRYTLHPQGASFGTKFEGLKYSMEIDKIISGLFHTGSVGIIMSGWLGAANYGVITANNVDKYLTK